MESHTLKELISEGSFKYDKKESPADNYRLFQQAISFEKGVEFLSSSNEHTGPIIYLIKVPGLSTDLKQTKNLLEKFNKDLLEHFTWYAKNRKDIFEVHEIFLDLYNAVLLQQEEYHDGKEKYFGIATVREYPHKDIKKLKLPIIRSHYRGTFLNTINGPYKPIEFKTLGPEIKDFLSSLYLLKRRFNMRLLKELNSIKQIVFYKENNIRRYEYSGDIADIVELALALKETGKLQSLNAADLDVNEFCRDLCRLVHLSYKKLSNYLPTIISRNREGKLFLNEAKKLLNSSPEL